MFHMASFYEDELNRLLKETKAKIKRLKKQGGKSREIDILKADIDLLEADLKHFQKAMERFRAEHLKPSPIQGAPAS